MVPALAAGCCIILKPSELAPLSCLLLADMCTHAGECVRNSLKGKEGEAKRRGGEGGGGSLWRNVTISWKVWIHIS